VQRGLAPERDVGEELVRAVRAERVHERAGLDEARSNLGEALVAYDRLRCVLRDELGTVPGREIQAVHERLLRKA
jgi:hypothetical protein